MVNQRNKKKGLLLLMATLFFLSGLGLFSTERASAENAETLKPDASHPLVSDYANILSTNTVNQIQQVNQKMASYDDQVQIAVLTVKSTNGQSIADFTNDLTLRSDWHPGSKKYDNGVLIVFAKNGGKNNVRIATGTGMEQYLPDATLHKLLLQNQEKLKSSSTSQNDQGILDLFLDVRAAYAGNPSPHHQTSNQQQHQATTHRYTTNKGLPNGIVLLLLIVIIIIIWKIFTSLKRSKQPEKRAYDFENYQDTHNGHKPSASTNGFSWFWLGWLMSWLFSGHDNDHHDHFDGSGGFGGGSDFGDWGDDSGGDFGGGDFGGGGSDF